MNSLHDELESFVYLIFRIYLILILENIFNFKKYKKWLMIFLGVILDSNFHKNTSCKNTKKKHFYLD